MRVTLVISSLGSGGAERVLSSMAGYWAERNWSVTVLTLDGGQEPPFYALHREVVHRPLGISGASHGPFHGIVNNLKRIRTLRKAIQKSRPDVVIAFMDAVNVLTLAAAARTKLPVIISERTDPAFNQMGGAWRLLRRLTYPLASCLVVQSVAAREFFPPRMRGRTRVIPNPVNSLPARITPRTDQHLKHVVAMGRLHQQKGFDLLLMAFARLTPFFPEWSLNVWGEGDERPALERLRDRLGLGTSVHFPGRTTDPFGKLRESDLFVLSSRIEGFPNALCEAMACGLPVISFDCPSGPNSIIRNEIDGLLVPAGDVDALTAAMRRLMSSEADRHRLSCRAQEISERFRLEDVMAMWESVIARVCNGRTKREEIAA
jgi:glycosyltransferase involved in cell wall biosynthesis